MVVAKDLSKSSERPRRSKNKKNEKSISITNGKRVLWKNEGLADNAIFPQKEVGKQVKDFIEKTDV